MTNNTVPFSALRKGMWIAAIEAVDGDVGGGWVGKIANIGHSDKMLILIDHLDDEEYLDDNDQMTYIVLQDAPKPDYTVRREDYDRLKVASDAAENPSSSTAPRSSVETSWLDEFRAAVKATLDNAEAKND